MNEYKHMNQSVNQVWIKTIDQKISALLADEAKGAKMLNDVLDTVKQLKAKSSFRIALINQLIEDREKSPD
jgi:hypothetical protein